MPTFSCCPLYRAPPNHMGVRQDDGTAFGAEGCRPFHVARSTAPRPTIWGRPSRRRHGVWRRRMPAFSRCPLYRAPPNHMGVRQDDGTAFGAEGCRPFHVARSTAPRPTIWASVRTTARRLAQKDAGLFTLGRTISSSNRPPLRRAGEKSHSILARPRVWP
jgi:hypothetical protein